MTGLMVSRCPRDALNRTRRQTNLLGNLGRGGSACPQTENFRLHLGSDFHKTRIDLPPGLVNSRGASFAYD